MTDRNDTARSWPQFALRIRVGDDVRLVAPDDDQLAALAKSASRPAAVLAESQSHFVTWIHGRTAEQIEHHHLQRVRANRDLTLRPGWTIDLAILVGGEPVGMQSISGFDDWPRRRVVGTTAWLLASHQRRGVGTACRAAVLELAFAHLAAHAAMSWVLEDNSASIKVSTRLGYRQIDRHTLRENGREFAERVYQLEAERWLESAPRRRYAPAITGAAGVAAVLRR